MDQIHVSNDIIQSILPAAEKTQSPSHSEFSPARFLVLRWLKQAALIVPAFLHIMVRALYHPCHIILFFADEAV